MIRVLLPSLALLAACMDPLDTPEGRDLLAHAAVEQGGTTLHLEVCGNGVDDDGDGYRDRDDPDCREEYTLKSRVGVELGYYGETLEGSDWWPDWPSDTREFEVKLEIDGEAWLLTTGEATKGEIPSIDLWRGGEEHVATIAWETKGVPYSVEVVRGHETERDSLIFALDDESFHLVPGPIEGKIGASQPTW
jgi:hypothetical protein